MAEANKPVPKAKVTVFGKVRLSVAPVDPENPIAVGDNDPRLSGLTPSVPYGSEKGIAASTTQTQAAAYQLTKQTNRIDNCVTDFDGVKVFAATENSEFYILNATIKKPYVYPKSGERFRQGLNLLAINAPIAVPSRTVLSGYCFEGEAGIFTIK